MQDEHVVACIAFYRQSWTKLLIKFIEIINKFFRIMFKWLLFPHSMLDILTTHYTRTKPNIVLGEGGVIAYKIHELILITPKLYVFVNFINRFCPRLQVSSHEMPQFTGSVPSASSFPFKRQTSSAAAFMLFIATVFACLAIT